MCRVIDSETVLRSYFNKYQYRNKITYKRLNEIRSNAEPKMDNVYIDITYSSLRDVMSLYPKSIGMDNTSIRIIGRGFRSSQIAQTSAYQALSPYL